MAFLKLPFCRLFECPEIGLIRVEVTETDDGKTCLSFRISDHPDAILEMAISFPQDDAKQAETLAYQRLSAMTLKEARLHVIPLLAAYDMLNGKSDA